MERQQRPHDGREYESARERLLHDVRASSGESSRALYTVALGLSIFLLILALSFRQVTSPGIAQRALESGLAALTEVDAVLAERGAELRQAATAGTAETYSVPGYPLPILLTRDEVLQSAPEQLRAVVLRRSAALVYNEGLKAFDRTGNQELGLLTSQGALRLTLGQLTKENYDRANLATGVLALAAVILAVVTLLVQRGFGRVRSLGLGFLCGALPGIALAMLLRFGWSRYGGDDPFAANLREIADTLLAVPYRNYAVVAVLGLVLVVSSVVLGRLDRRFGSGRMTPGEMDDHEELSDAEDDDLLEAAGGRRLP